MSKDMTLSNSGPLLQSIIAKHVVKNLLAGMASLGLSAVFDMVNIKLLLSDSTSLEFIKICLENRSFYVSIDGKNSMLVELLCGIVQGSVLGPILYAVYVFPLFDLHKIANFDDNNFIMRWNRHMHELVA